MSVPLQGGFPHATQTLAQTVGFHDCHRTAPGKQLHHEIVGDAQTKLHGNAILILRNFLRLMERQRLDECAVQSVVFQLYIFNRVGRIVPYPDTNAAATLSENAASGGNVQSCLPDVLSNNRTQG